MELQGCNYALIAYFILPKWRDTLNSCWQFISNTWADKWFSIQFFNPEDLYDLTEAIYVTKAKNPLNTIDNRSWNKDPSRIEVTRTNIVAERAIQKMDKIIQSSNKNSSTAIYLQPLLSKRHLRLERGSPREKSKNSFNGPWSTDPSRLDTPRTDIVAESPIQNRGNIVQNLKTNKKNRKNFIKSN